MQSYKNIILFIHAVMCLCCVGRQGGGVHLYVLPQMVTGRRGGGGGAPVLPQMIVILKMGSSVAVQMYCHVKMIPGRRAGGIYILP